MAWGDGLSDLVDALYATALLPDGWGSWTKRASAWLGGFATGFTVWDNVTAAVHCQILDHPSAAALERYIDEEIWRLDPQIPILRSKDRLTVFTDVDHLDHDDPATREYLRWQATNSAMGHYLSIVTPVSKKVHAGLSIHRHIDDGATPNQAREQLEAIAPHIGRALQLGFAHSHLLVSAYWDGLLAERMEPAFLLGEDGRVLRSSTAASALLSSEDGLDVAKGRLIAVDRASDNALQSVIGCALLAAHPCAGAARIVRGSGRAALIVSAFPLIRRVRALAPAEAAALVTVVDPTRTARAKAFLWQQAYGLTPREAMLAEQLVRGHSVESATAVLEISINTARVHLRRLMEKTATHRQSDLIRLLGRLG